MGLLNRHRFRTVEPTTQGRHITALQVGHRWPMPLTICLPQLLHLHERVFIDYYHTGSRSGGYPRMEPFYKSFRSSALAG